MRVSARVNACGSMTWREIGSARRSSVKKIVNPVRSGPPFVRVDTDRSSCRRERQSTD